jgi:hypothetical protein
MTTAQGTINLDDARATGSAVTSFRDSVTARLAAELDNASRWLSPTPDPFNGAEIVGDVGDVGDAPNDEDRDILQAEEQAAREQKDAAELAAAIVTVRASFDVIVDATERMVDALVAAVVADNALRSAVKARIRPDLVAWPTPWVRPRKGRWVSLPDDDGRPGRRRAFEMALAGVEEREAHRQHPELSALARLVLEREVRSHLVGEADDLGARQEARRWFSAYARDGAASFAWRAIGGAAKVGAALRLAARLAGVDLNRTARDRHPNEPPVTDDDFRLARGDVDHVEVPGVGWVYASTLALVGHALQEATQPVELATLAARAVLDEAVAKGDEVGRHPLAHRMLTRVVEDGLSRSPPHREDVEIVDGVHPLDEALAELLDGIGETGRKLGGEVRGSRKSPKDRADRWRPYVDPLRVPRLLARVFWRDAVAGTLRDLDEQDARARERRALVPAPTIHPVTRTAILLANRGAHRDPDGSVSFGSKGTRVGYLPPVALVSVGEKALSEAAGKIVPLLAAWLSMEAWKRWQHGVQRFDWIAFPAGRSGLRERGLDADEDELDEAIAYLQELKIGGLPCIDASPPPQEFVDDERRGGRPEKRRILRAGAPLVPVGLESVYRDAGMTLPPELRFFSPVLNPAEAPLIGHRQTYARQRGFFALGIGDFFIQRREEYAERGGVKIDAQTWRRHLDASGIYHRSHQSLADQMFDAYRSHPPGLPGIGPRPAVLVETTPGSGTYRFGPDFAEQERVVLNAAETTARRKRDAQKRQAAKRRRAKDAP